jgi:membrane dipeptidase
MNRRQILAGGALLVSATGAAAAPRSSNIVVSGTDGKDMTRDYVLTLRKVGVDVWQSGPKGRGLRGWSELYQFRDKNADIIAFCKSAADIRRAKAEGKVGFVAGWQTANAVSNGREGVNDWWSGPGKTELRAYKELGLRICGIAYQIANDFGGGGIDGTIGLTRAGRMLVEEIHSLKIVLDVGGHTGDATSRDAIAMSAGVPIVSTHSNVRTLANSSRNLPDDLIDAIAKSGGVIGINAINDFVMRGREMANLDRTPQGTYRDLLKHADYIKRRVGAEHVGIGSDFVDDPLGLGAGVRDYPLFGPEVIDKAPRRFVTGFGNITELPNLRTGLQELGWTDSEIAGFMGGNFMRVYEKVWGA